MKLFYKCICVIALLATTFNSSAQTAAPELVFLNPVLKSGQAKKEGAVYRFSNVTTGVDAEVKLKNFSRNDIVMSSIDNNTLGWSKAFQPEFGLPGLVLPFQQWYIDFEMTFYKAGTNIKQKMSKIDLTALDVDGDNWSISEYVTYDNPLTVTYSPVSYLVNSGISLLGVSLPCAIDNISSPLVKCGGCGGNGLNGANECVACDGSGFIHDLCDHAYQGVIGATIQGPVQNFTNIDTSATQVMATYHYENKDKIKFRYGAKSSSLSSNGSGIRLNSTWFRQFSLAPLGTLPVTFHDFTATLNKTNILLKWVVDTDDDFSHYVVERSTDGKNYSDVGIVFTTGHLNEMSFYQFKDENISRLSGVVYYRLRWEESTKETLFSHVRIVRIGMDKENLAMTTYPNPVKDELRITFPASWQGKAVQIELYSGNGTRVQQFKIGNASQTESMNLHTLPRGFYVVKATCSNELAQQRIIKD